MIHNRRTRLEYQKEWNKLSFQYSWSALHSKFFFSWTFVGSSLVWWQCFLPPGEVFNPHFPLPLIVVWRDISKRRKLLVWLTLIGGVTWWWSPYPNHYFVTCLGCPWNCSVSYKKNVEEFKERLNYWIFSFPTFSRL